jgi:hypothetical protein
MKQFLILLALATVNGFSYDSFSDANDEIQPIKKGVKKTQQFRQQKETLPDLNTKRTKRLASVDANQSRARIRDEAAPQYFYPKNYKVGIVGGLSTAKSTDVNNQLVRDTNSLSQNIYAGLNLDLTPFQFFGLEVEGFYGISPMQGLASLKQFGGVADLKFYLPFYFLGMEVTPKVGAGYGILALNQSSSDMFNPETNSNANGFNIVAGIDFDIAKFMVLSVDYAFSVGATGNYSIAGVNTAVAGTYFDRLRAGGYIRILPMMGIGVQYIRRTIQSTNSPFVSFNGEPTQNETLNQFLGTLVFEF